MTLVASALAGGDCIGDADVLRTGGTAGAMGCVVKAPSTLGTFLRSFRWGHVRQLDRVSRELLARAWAAGAGPGDGPLTIDLDSTICETYGLAKEGARHHGYTGQRGYHPLWAVAAGTGDVLMVRLREGRAYTARGAAHFLRETVGRVRHAGATGQLTMWADSGFYTHASSRSAASWMSASPSLSASTKACAISSRPYRRRTGRRSPTGWTAPPTWRRPPTEPVSEVRAHNENRSNWRLTARIMVNDSSVIQSLPSRQTIFVCENTCVTGSTPPFRARPTPRRCGSSSGG